jgi:uncharacterized membrane protein YdbT with pleckstrin-like domain
MQERQSMLVIQIASLILDAYIFYKVFHYLIVGMGFSALQAFGVTVAVSFAITLVLYVYTVYIVTMPAKSKKATDDKRKAD